MMEKRNRTCEKTAAGDAGDIDDLVDGAAKRFARPNAPERRPREGVLEAKEPECRG